MMIFIKKNDDINDDDDFNNGKIHKISSVLNDILYIGATCNTLPKRFSQSKKE